MMKRATFPCSVAAKSGGRAVIPVHTRPSGVTVMPVGALPVRKLFTAELTASTRDTVPARQLVTQTDPGPNASPPDPSPVCTNPF
jgi:hypothetical protein